MKAVLSSVYFGPPLTQYGSLLFDKGQNFCSSRKQSMNTSMITAIESEELQNVPLAVEKSTALDLALESLSGASERVAFDEICCLLLKSEK